MDGGDHEDVGFVGEEALEAFPAFCLASIIAFPSKFGSGICDGFVEVKAFGKEAGGGKEDGKVIEVRVDGVGDAGVLDLYSDAGADGFEDSAVDLADRGRGHGSLIKGGKEVTPVRAKIACKDFVALEWGHVIGAILNSLENFVDCRGKHFGIWDKKLASAEHNIASLGKDLESSSSDQA